MIRVLLADDHPVVRAGLRGMLAAEPDIEVAGEAGSGPEAVAVARAGDYDVILMDLRMPGGDGVAATREILSSGSAARVLVVTTYETDADILRAVEAGATGYLLKDATPAELANAVRRGRAWRDRARAIRRRAPGFARPPAAARIAVRPGNRGPGPGRARRHQRRDRPSAPHQRGDRQDPPAPRVRQTRRIRPHRRGHHRPATRSPPSAWPVTAASRRPWSVRSARTACAPASASAAAQ